jgi:hypothetical protein
MITDSKRVKKYRKLRLLVSLAFASNQRYTVSERKVNNYGKHIPCICKNRYVPERPCGNDSYETRYYALRGHPDALQPDRSA